MKIRVDKTGDPGPGDKPKSPVGTPTTDIVSQRTHGKIPDQLDVRDAISNFVGSGVKDFKDPQRLKDFHYISNILGQDAATKLMNHVFLFNNRSDMGGKSPQQRVQSFYDIGSNDPMVNKMLQGYKTVDQAGPAAAMGTAGDTTNQQLTGRLPYIASGKIGS
jgi:hypothetical protein